MSSKKLVLVTGANGFAGAHIVNNLLQAGYAVRGTCRTGRADELKKTHATPDFQVAIVNEIVEGDFSAALKDVHAVIHTASPLPNSKDDIMTIVLGSTMNIIRQAHAAGINKIILFGTIAATFNGLKIAFDSSLVIRSSDWNIATREDAKASGLSRMAEYSIAKTLAERDAWEFAASHPEVDLTILLPGYFFGPFGPGQTLTEAKSLGCNIWICQLLSGAGGTYPISGLPHFLDVRDVARAAVLSLSAPPAPPGERKRIILVGGHFWWKEAVKHIAAVRPELKDRLLDGGNPANEEYPPVTTFDTRDAMDVLGMTDFTGWEKSVMDTVDSILQKESGWKFPVVPLRH